LEGEILQLIKELRFLTLLLIAVLLVQNAGATSVLFDFDDDDLPWWGGAAAIESYMEQVYGSDITVVGGTVGKGIFLDPLHDFPGDRYIQTGLGCKHHMFSLSFNEIPVTAVSFDWGVRMSSFRAYADDDEEAFFTIGGWDWWDSGNSGTIFFESPVTTLKFTGPHFLGEIEVDNLVVTCVPEPATILLLGMGAALLTLTQKKRSV
jgi:hypothetical protein